VLLALLEAGGIVLVTLGALVIIPVGLGVADVGLRAHCEGCEGFDSRVV